MKFEEKDLAMAISKDSGGMYCPPPSAWFEIRLFYVRIAPCVVDNVPDHLTLHHLRRENGVSLEINGTRIPSSDMSSLVLRRGRINKEAPEVTYVSTDSVSVTGGIEFEVLERNNEMVLCGNLERMDGNNTWGCNNGSVGLLENDSRMGWSMECYTAASIASGSSPFFQPKMGVSSPLLEVNIAGCCSGVPVILTKTILTSPRRKPVKHSTLDVIPEDEEIAKELNDMNALVHHRKVQITEDEDDCDSDGKMALNYYPEGMYYTDDGQLSWFNAGVRVGVGIGLGMCLGVGIGVGLLMHSYQATTSDLRRRFF